jgi:integrase
MRVGALAKLKLSDIIEEWDNPRLLLTRTPDDITDPRKRKPQQKTKPLASPISKQLLKTIKHYIDTDRKKFDKNSTHDFLFVSEKGKNKGQPLSMKGVYNITKTLSRVLNFDFCPHLLRHKYNEIFDIKATAMGYAPEKIEDCRKYLMGWSEDSKMGAVYNEFRNAVKVREITASDQTDFFSKKENKSDAS